MDHSDHWGVHLAYTVPAIGVLWSAARPLLCRSDYLKISLVTAATVAYATQRGGRVVLAAPSDRSSSDRWAAAALLEACASVAAQTVLTLLWSTFCFRWSTPCLSFNHDERSYKLIRWAPVCALAVVSAAVCTAAGHGAETVGPAAAASSSSPWSYAGALVRWSSPAVAFAWYGAGNLFARRTVPSAVAVAVPTAYLCWADRACRLAAAMPSPAAAGPAAAFALRHLPPGHACLFYAAVNALVVLFATGYDKAAGMADAYGTEFGRPFAYGPRYVAQLCRAFVTAEYTVPAGVVRDIRACFRVLNGESTTFAAAVLLFQGGESESRRSRAFTDRSPRGVTAAGRVGSGKQSFPVRIARVPIIFESLR